MLLPQVGQGDGGNGFDHRNRTGDDAGIVPSLDLEFSLFHPLIGNGFLFERDGRRGTDSAGG